MSLASLILSHMNLLQLLKKKKQKTKNKKPTKKTTPTTKTHCLVLFEDAVVMNTVFPERRSTMQGSIACLRTTTLLSSAPVLILTLTQEQPGQRIAEHSWSCTSLPFSSNETQPHPNLWVVEGTIPSHSRAALPHRWCTTGGCSSDLPGSRNMIYSSLFSLLFPTSLPHTDNFRKAVFDK